LIIDFTRQKLSFSGDQDDDKAAKKGLPDTEKNDAYEPGNRHRSQRIFPGSITPVYSLFAVMLLVLDNTALYFSAGCFSRFNKILFSSRWYGLAEETFFKRPSITSFY